MDENELILRVNFDHGHLTVDRDRFTVFDAQGRVLWYMSAKEMLDKGFLMTIPKESPFLLPDEVVQPLGSPISFAFGTIEEVMS